MPTERIFLELEGSEAAHGISLLSLESFMKNFRRALVDFDRSQSGERTRREGRRRLREEWVTAFRVIGLQPGSTRLELEPIAPRQQDRFDGDQERIDAEFLAAQNLRALIDAIASVEPLEPDVTEAVAAARRTLGVDGQIGVVFAGGPQKERRVVIDGQRIEELRTRRQRAIQTVTRVSGRLHMVDVDPFRVGIRTSSGVEWICEYTSELEGQIIELLKLNVAAHGHGVLTSQGRGHFQIETIEPIGEYEQTELFSVERRPLAELLARHGLEPQGWDVFADPDWQDDEDSKRFLEALLDGESTS